MNCIICGSEKTKITETRCAGTRVIRKRRCRSCMNIFITEEIGYIRNDALNREFNNIKYEANQNLYDPYLSEK